MSYDIAESGKRIRQLRTQKGYTQEEIARALNIDRSFMAVLSLAKRVVLWIFLFVFPAFLQSHWIILSWAKIRPQSIPVKLERS